MKRPLLMILFSCLGSSAALGDSSCTLPRTSRDLMSCAEWRSPEVQKAQVELDHSKALIESAGQWRNPELSLETFHGQVDGQSQEETDVALGIPIELGGGISARQNLARGGHALSEAALFEARVRIRSQVLTKLHRLRQVFHEQEIIDEAIQTFTKLIGQYARRPGFSPEQQVSFSVYQLSKSEYEMKRTKTSEEIAGLDAFFQFHLGLGAEKIRLLLPTSPKSWPQIGTREARGSSPKQQMLEAELTKARAESSLAISEAWPTLTLGPSYKTQTDRGRSNALFGINVSLPLPLFSLNGGGRAAAAIGVKNAETRRALGLQEQALRREELRQVYDQSVRAMAKSLSHEEIEKRHRDAERLFAKGVVPSALVIEAHRTSLELEKARHECEIRALEALLELHVIDGVIFEEGIL